MSDDYAPPPVHLLILASTDPKVYSRTACGLSLDAKGLATFRRSGLVTSWASVVTCHECQTRTPKTSLLAQATQDRMVEHAIPQGTDDPLLLALGASPLPEEDPDDAG